MKLNRTGSNWTGLERNKINENWSIIEGSYNDVVENVSEKAFEQVVDSAKLDWKEPVDSFNDLPSSASEGETRMVRDTGKVYRYNGSAWVEIQQIDAGPVNELDTRLTQQLAETANELLYVQQNKATKEELYRESDFLRGFSYTNLKLSIENNPNLVNMIKNGDFTRGLNPWEDFIGAEILHQDEKMLIRGDGSNRLPRVRQTTDVDYSVGDIIYFYMDFIALNDNSNSFGFQIFGDNDNFTELVTTSDYRANEEVFLSQNMTVPDTFEGDLRIQIRANFPDASAADGSGFLVDNINVINSTKLFGKGNEPSADDMKMLIDLFNGYIPHEVKNTINSSIFGYLKQRPTISKRPLIALTFDDNFKTDIDMVYPLLQARGIRATTYVITGDVEVDPRKMDWDDLRTLRSAGWTIGCHSHDHINLGNATDQEIRNQMQLVNQTMVNNGFSMPNHHSLPFGGGRENPRVLNILKDYRKTVRQTGGNSYNNYDTVDFYNIYGKQADINDNNINRLNLRKSDIDAT